jgi:predicted TIM-barrel fold metal-dependent hydrolase
MIIDSHVHVWSDDLTAYPWAPHDQVTLPSAPATWSDLLRTLDQTGVAGAICLQPRIYGYDHGYLNSVLEARPDRFAGVCIVNPVRASGPDELRHLVREYGYRGIRLNPMASSNPTWLDGPEGAPLWRAAVDLDIVVSVLIEPAQLPWLVSAARRYPEARIVIDHLGRCTPQTPLDQQAVLVQLAEVPNVSLKISALSTLAGAPFPYAALHPLIEQCYRAYGPDRLIWGTDYPHILEAGPYGCALDAVRDGLTFIDPGHLPAILGENAHRLYRLPTTWGQV